VFVVNSGDETISVLNGSSVPTTGAVEADVVVTPQTLNLQSNGEYVAARIEIAGFFPQTIDVSSVRLEGVVPAILDKWSISDSDLDGNQELEVKFDRALVQAILPQGEFVPVTISGIVGTRSFVGTDIIRTIRPSVTHPLATSPVIPGATTLVTWTTPQGYATDKADVHLSLDDGGTWTALALQVPNTGSISWTVPNGFYEQCRILVTLWNQGAMLGHGMSPEPFIISTTIPTRLASVDLGVEDGVAVLRWETSMEIGMEGFEVARAESESGLYRDVSDGLIRASGSASGGHYEFRDDGLSANRTYWYKLREVTAGGDGAEFGPYSVVFRLAYGLDQNAPNPFNPTTTIKYAIAADGPVSLTIYDVGGRRVRTLVDETLRANVYRTTWDGRNDNGASVASGMYFYKLVAGKYTQTRKMMLLK
jgi:hypothetical protein